MGTDIPENIVVIGKFGAPHGVKGAVKVFSYTEPQDSILDFENFFVRPKSKKAVWKKLDVEQIQQHGNAFLFFLENVADRDEAALYTHQEVGVSRSSFPDEEDDEHYWADILGAKVYNTENQCLGVVDDFMETGANDVLVVKGENEYLIPYTPGVHVLEVNVQDNKIIVDWPYEF